MQPRGGLGHLYLRIEAASRPGSPTAPIRVSDLT
jgi:hypothetical protein